MTSLEGQKKYLIENLDISVLMSLYDDNEVCKLVECELIKGLQLIPRPSLLSNDYDDYSTQFRSFIYDFLFNGKDASYILQKIDNIVKIYSVPVNPSDSKVGFIVFIITIVLIIIILSSLIFLYMKKFKNHFSFFTNDCWIIIFIGFILYLSNIFIQYGEVTKIKCELKIVLTTFGFSFITIPVLYQLISNFHEKKKIIMLIENGKYRFFSICILFDVIMSAFSLLFSIYDIKTFYIKDGKNYQTCSITTYGKIIFSLIIVEKLFIALLISFMIFLEWNITKTSRDIKLITSTLYINILLAIILVILQNIKINNYNTLFIIFTSVILVFVFSCHFFMYGIRLLFMILSKDKPKLQFIKHVDTTTTSNKYNKSITNESGKNSTSFSIKILQYHYYTGDEDKENGNITTMSVPTVSTVSNRDL